MYAVKGELITFTKSLLLLRSALVRFEATALFLLKVDNFIFSNRVHQYVIKPGIGHTFQVSLSN